MGRFRIKRGPGKQPLRGSDFRLADEVRYIQGCAARHDSRIVSIGPLLLFSTETGDAWMLDPADQLAAPIARQGEALSVHLEDTDRNFSVAWTGNYRIDGELFLYREKDSGNTRTIFGYRPSESLNKFPKRFAERDAGLSPTGNLESRDGLHREGLSVQRESARRGEI
jgi:hypothetical protein